MDITAQDQDLQKVHLSVQHVMYQEQRIVIHAIVVMFYQATHITNAIPIATQKAVETRINGVLAHHQNIYQEVVVFV